MNIWIKWQIKVITAGHGDGYCSGEDNQEDITYEEIFSEYEVTEDEYYTLIWLYNECRKIFELKSFIKAIRPIIENESINNPFGSGYCNPSKHGLQHEIQKTPNKIIDLIINKNEVPKNNKIKGNNYGIRRNLPYIIIKNQTINECLENILPTEIIDIILQYMWNGFIEDGKISEDLTPYYQTFTSYYHFH